MSNIFNTYFDSMGQQLSSTILPPIKHTYPVKVNEAKIHACYMIVLLRR